MIILDVFLFIFRWAVTTVLWLAVWIPIYILGFFVTWIGLLFCKRSSEHMAWPWYFWDNNHGINGTLGYNNMNWIGICNPELFDLTPSKRIKAAYKLVDTQTGKERSFKNRWLWVTWRNPVSNLSLYPMGLKITKPVNKVIKDNGRFRFEKVTSGLGWFYSLTIRYNSERGFFYGIGWKFLDPSEDRARFIYRISPNRELPKD